jgi:hypothetical protein
MRIALTSFFLETTSGEPIALLNGNGDMRCFTVVRCSVMVRPIVLCPRCLLFASFKASVSTKWMGRLKGKLRPFLRKNWTKSL